MVSEGFAAVPTWMVRDHSVSRHALLVYAALASRAGLAANVPSQALLAKEARCSERTARDAIAELEQLGVIERTKRGSRKGGRATDGYRLLSRPLDTNEFPATTADNSELPANPEGVTGNELQVTPLIEVDRTEVDKPPVIPHAEASIDDAFTAFWATYPRRVGKLTARKAFSAAANRAGGVSSVLDGARRLRDDPNLPDLQYVPHPSTWLNRDGWDDDPLPPRHGGPLKATTLDVAAATHELLNERARKELAIERA